jgi:ribonuclease Y
METELFVALLVGAALGFGGRILFIRIRKNTLEETVSSMLLSAREEAQTIKEKAATLAAEIDREAGKLLTQAKDEERRIAHDLKRLEERLVKKEEHLDARQGELDKELSYLKEKAEEVKVLKETIEQQKDRLEKEFETISKMSKQEVFEHLVDSVRVRHEEDLLVLSNKLSREGAERLDRKAKEILTTAIHRLDSKRRYQRKNYWKRRT